MFLLLPSKLIVLHFFSTLFTLTVTRNINSKLDLQLRFDELCVSLVCPSLLTGRSISRIIDFQTPGGEGGSGPKKIFLNKCIAVTYHPHEEERDKN